ARPRLISEYGALVPGKTNTIALTFDMDEGWHTYWPGQNDTGLPITFTLDPPDGFEVGEPLWPAPHRHISEGGILDHVYGPGESTVLIPVRVPSDARAGQRVVFKADVEWLVCREACIPGWGTAVLTLPVSAPGETLEPSPNRDRILAARRRVPVPLPEMPRDVSVRWAGGVLEIRALRPVREITFSPGEKSRPIRDLLKSGESKKGVLRLVPEDGTKPVVGVIELMPKEKGKPSRLYRIETSPPGGGG
ncbi:MAG TPA: hypothetical protein ENK11_00345, partial [Phycisphaerales bacterium]|nr:hypothetical protein [Phycisphaerales bacterium]